MIKKVVFLMALSAMGVASVHAQEVNFGAKAGFNIANVMGDNTGSLDAVTAFNAGLMAEIPLSEKFSIQPELLFSGQGYSFGDNVVALNYLNLPVIGKYYVMKGLSLEAGPQLGLLLSAKNEGTDVKDSFRSVDFGINAGLGYKFDNGLNFSARYNFGLTNIIDQKLVINNNTNGVFQVSVGYFFF
ncbi:porin family protein [Flavobacterium sp. SM2513]|uniref:porin family protein n=1 Tax=Flavobacterium sp. SM2513 TaxID=3424766 RepID=UPI003D7FB371